MRVYDDVNSFQPGKWFMREEDIRGLSPEEIKNLFGLKQIPTKYTYVELKAGDTVRATVANDVFESNGGGLQFDMMGERNGRFFDDEPLIP